MSNPPSPRDPEQSVADPTTSAGDLRLIAYYRPELRARVAAHPNAYPGLLDWLDVLGDPEVSAAVAARRAADMPPEPVAIDEGAADTAMGGAEEPQASDESAFAPTEVEEQPGEEEPAEADSPVEFTDDDDLEATREAPAIESLPEDGGDPASSSMDEREPDDTAAGRPGSDEPAEEESATAVLPAAESATAEFPRVEEAPSGPVERASIFPAGTSPALDDEPGAGAVWDAPMPAANPWAPEAVSAQPTRAAGWAAEPADPDAAPVATPTGWAPTGAAPSAGATPQWPGAAPVAPEDGREAKRGIPVPLAVLVAIALVLLLVVGWLVTNGFGTRTPTTAGSDSSTTGSNSSTTGSADSGSSSAQSSATDAAQSEPSEPKYPAPAGAVDMAQLTAPSGNIACVLGTDAVTCQIYETRWAGTSFDTCGGRSYGVLVATADTAENSCAQGDVGDVRNALPYGSYATHGDFACSSTEDGISCWNTMTGTSFALARGGWMVGDTGEIAPSAFTW
ncbi:variant leucine-rich repeat-containing protein [Actinomyces culturomici]|uniref:variant leucine-rich repeat-containing protein n=1 Tax=Actinomyces culturomici TaxID=1926276 RepID=UPI000E1FF2D1|nr:hypothetical protein [Actinomyces culturomici]